MQVAIIQSSYIPWKGYFDIIRDVDTFVFLDQVQFTVRDWRTRNRIKTKEGGAWLSVPAGSNRNRCICEVQLADHQWQATHWNKMQHAYRNAPFFAHYREFFSELYENHRWTNLSVMNQTIIRKISTDLLGIRTPFQDSRKFDCQGRRDDLLLDILKKLGATRYLSGPAARDYIDPAKFATAGIELEFKDYSHYPEYPQQHPPFDHAVSVVDLLFNLGPASVDYIWGGREPSR